MRQHTNTKEIVAGQSAKLRHHWPTGRKASGHPHKVCWFNLLGWLAQRHCLVCEPRKVPQPSRTFSASQLAERVGEWEVGRGGEKALTFWLKRRRGALAVEGADNSQGELFTPTEGGWDGRLFGTESWYHQRQLALVCCAQALTVQHSWSIGRPDEKGYCRVEIGRVYARTEMRARWQFWKVKLGKLEPSCLSCPTDASPLLVCLGLPGFTILHHFRILWALWKYFFLICVCICRKCAHLYRLRSKCIWMLVSGSPVRSTVPCS